MCIVVAIVMALTVLPSMQGSSHDDQTKTAGTSALAPNVFNVGIVGYAGSVATLNPFMYTTTEEFETTSPVYSSVLMYDLNANLVGDLATSWSVSADGLTWNIKLASNAYFCDPANPTVKVYQVTATDVIWTLHEVANDVNNHLNSYLSNGDFSVISSMWTGTDQFDLYIKTWTPYAPFLNALTEIPIVPEYIWGHLSGGRTPTTFANIPMVGSGPFYSDMKSLPLTVGVLKRNPIWFHETNQGWHINVDVLQLKNEMSSATAWTDLTQNPPLIDTYLNVPPSQYISSLRDSTTPNVIGWARSTGFVYEYQLNQLSNDQRAARGMYSGSNNQLLLNSTVKLAMAMCVEKQTFIDQVILGLGTVADSLVPDCSPWHYTYPNPVQYDPLGARALLMAAGWAFDSSGAPATSNTVPLCKAGGLDPLKFRLMSLTSGAEWMMGSYLLQQWASLGGVELDVFLVSGNQMNSAWYAGDYDAWLWDWVFTPTSDPSTDCLSIDTTMAIGTWSGSYWHNPTYDALYNESLAAVDPVARRVLTDQLQAMVYEDHNDQLIAYSQELCAASTVNWEATSYGDWSQHWELMPDQGLPWLYMQLNPVSSPPVPVLPVMGTVTKGGTDTLRVGFSAPVPSTLGFVIENHGLKSLTLTYSFSGKKSPANTMVIKISFEKSGAYPTGDVVTVPVALPAHSMTWVTIGGLNGAKGTYAVIYEDWSINQGVLAPG